MMRPIMTLLDNILLQQQTLITCRAFFPDSEISISGVVLCYKDGKLVVAVEINRGCDGKVTYDVWVYQDHSKTIYSVSYDRMCSRLKELNRIL